MGLFTKQWTKILSVILVEALLFPGGISFAKNSNRSSLFIDVPERVGRVSDHYAGDDQRVIIHIEDAHCNVEAQQNIYRILGNLFHANQSLSFIGIEGAASTVDTKEFAAYPDKQAKWDGSFVYMREGRISGAEFFAINRDKESSKIPAIEGIEDPYLYMKNYEALVQALPLVTRAKEYCKSIRSILDTLKTSIYSQDLREFDLMNARYEHKSISFGEYYIYLYRKARQTGIDVSAYEDFKKVMNSIVQERRISIPAKNADEDALSTEFAEKLSEKTKEAWLELQGLYAKGMISAPYYYKEIQNIAAQNGIDIDKYEGLQPYIKFLEIKASINQEALFVQLTTIRDALQQVFARTSQEQQLAYLAKNMEIISRMFNLEITGEDFTYYLEHKDDFSIYKVTGFIRNYAPRYNVSYFIDPDVGLIDQGLPFVEQFYTIAHQRNTVLVNNALSEMEILGAKNGVIITGGFHTRGITDLLKERGISYYSISPEITRIQEDNPYLSLIMNLQQPSEMLLTQNSTRGALAIASFMARQMLMGEDNQEPLKNRLKMLFITNSMKNLLAGRVQNLIAGQIADLSSSDISNIQNAINSYIKTAGYDNFKITEITKDGNSVNISIAVTFADGTVQQIPFQFAQAQQVVIADQGTGQADIVQQVLSPEGPMAQAIELRRMLKLDGETESLKNTLVESDIQGTPLAELFENAFEVNGLSQLTFDDMVEFIRVAEQTGFLETGKPVKVGEFVVKAQKVGEGAKVKIDIIPAEQFTERYAPDINVLQESPLNMPQTEVVNNLFPQIEEIKQATDAQQVLSLIDAMMSNNFSEVDFQDQQQVQAVGRAIRDMIVSVVRNENWAADQGDQLLDQLNVLRNAFIAQAQQASDVVIADVGLDIGVDHDAVNLFIQEKLAGRQIDENGDFIADVVTPAGEGIFFIDDMKDFELAGHAGISRNAVYAANPIKAVHEMTELRLWRSFAKNVLGYTDEQIAQGQVRTWIQSMLAEGGSSRLLIQNLNKQFHDLGMQAEAFAADFITPTATQNQALANMISSITYSFIVNNQSDITAIMGGARQGMADLASQWVAQQLDSFDTLVASITEGVRSGESQEVYQSRITDAITALQDFLQQTVATISITGTSLNLEQQNSFLDAVQSMQDKLSGLQDTLNLGQINQQLDNISSLVQAAQTQQQQIEQIDTSIEGIDLIQTDQELQQANLQALQNKDFYDSVIDSASQKVQNGYASVAIIVDTAGRIISVGGAQDQIQALQQKIDANQAFAVVAKVKVDQAQDGPMLQLSIPSDAAQGVQDQLQQIETLFNQNISNLTALRVQAQAMDTNMQALQSGALYEAASQKAVDAANIKNGYVRVSVIVDNAGTILAVNPSESDMAELQNRLDLNQAFPVMARVKVDTVDGPMLQLSVSTKASQSVQDTMLNLQDAFNQEIPSLDFLKGRAEELAQLDMDQDAGWTQRVVDRIDVLASHAAAQGNTAQQLALQALNNLPDSNYLKQQLVQQLTQIAQQETSVEGITADQLLDIVASALLHNGVLADYDRAIPLHEQFSNIEKSLENAAENVLLADSQVRATYFNSLYNTLKDSSQRQIDQMIVQGIPTMQIIKMMENMDVSQDLVNTIQNKAYIAVQLQRKYEQAGLSQPSQNDLNSYVDIVYANLQQDRLSTLDVTSSKIDQLVAMLFDGAVLQTNLAQAQLQNDYIQPLIDVLTTEGDLQQQLASAVQIIEALNNNTLQERILNTTAMQEIVSLIQNKMTDVLNASPEMQVNFLAVLVNLSSVIPFSYSLMNDIEQQIKQVAENIITNRNISVQTKRAALAKINQFYEAFGYTADSTYISELESNIESRQPIIDATLNASLEVITSPEEYVRTSSKITSETVRMHLLDVMLDIDADANISESVKQSLVSALIALYENADLSIESQNKLAEALVDHAGAVNQLEGLTDADKTALFNLIANIAGLVSSNEQVDNMSSFMDVILAQAVLGGAQVAKVLTNTPIQLADSPDALGSVSANGSIVLDRNLLGQTDVLDVVLMEQVLSIQNQITDSLQDQALLSLLVLDYINNVYGAAQLDRLADDFESVMMQNSNLSLGRVQDFVDMINIFKLNEGKPEQQIQAALEFSVKQSMREQGLTTLDIIKQDNTLRSQVAQLLPVVAQLHENTDLMNNVIPQLQDNKIVLSYDADRGAGISPQQQAKIDGLEIVIPANLQDQINASTIQTIIYDAATNQVRVVVADELTGEQTLFVFDTTTQNLISQTAFDKILPAIGANEVINDFLNNIDQSVANEGEVVAGIRNGEVVQLRVGGLTLGQHIKQLFATEQQGSFIANLIDKLTNGQINIVVADQLPANLGDGNQFAGIYKDASTGKETIYITREAWDKISISDNKAPDNKAYALIGAIIRGAALLEGRDLAVDELFTKDISQRIWTNNIDQQYEALFFSELPMEQALKQELNDQMDQLDKRQEGVQKRREELAQQLVNQRERIQQRARDRFEDIPQLSMQAGDNSLEFEQWTVDELGNRKFLYFSYGDEAGQQVVLDLDALNETGRRLGDMVISKVGDEIRITFTHLGEQNTISILTDSAGVPSGYSVSKITESGTVVETYDVYGNAVNNFELIRSQQPAVADAALTSSQQIRQQIDELQSVPSQQRDIDKIQALKVQLVNSLLSDHDMFIDSQAEGYLQAAFDEIYNMINQRADVLSPTYIEKIVLPLAESKLSGALKRDQVTNVVIENIVYSVNLKDGSLTPVEQNAASRTGGVQMPLSYIESDRLVIYDTQGRRYELALDNSPAEAPVQYSAGQLISVGNILSKDIQEKQLEISKERSDAFKTRIETLNKEIDQFAKDIKELEQRQTRALQMNDTVMLQGVFVQMLNTREELARKHLEAINLRKQYLEEQRQIALVKYKMAISEHQPAQKAALFRSIQNAIETELAALNQREVSINQSLNDLNNQLTEARAKLETFEGRKAGSKAEQVVPVIEAVDQYIQDYLSNNKLEELIGLITAENLTITIPTRTQGDITVSARLIRDRLLEEKNYNNLIDFVNGLQGQSQQNMQKILDSVLMVTFDRAGASSISEGYEGAVMSAVAARAKDAGLQEKNLKETAQKYINQQQFSISAVGKERESLQLKQAAKKNLQFAIDQLHEFIGNLLSEEDQALVNLSNLEDSEKMINELLDLMGLEEGSADYADMLSNLQNQGDDLVRLYSMAKALSLADSEFSSLLARAIKTPDVMANEIIKLEGTTQEEQANRRNELAGNTAMENLQHFLILTHMAKTLVTPQSDNFQQMYDLLKTGDTGMDYLRKSLLTELIISLDVDAKLKSKIDKEAKATGKPVTEVRANQLRADIEKNDLGILTKRDQLLLTPNIADLQLMLRESLVKSGKYTDEIRKQLHARTGDLQQRVAQYDLINETVPDDIIADSFTSVMLASLIDNGYYFRDVQYFSGALMANGAILNVGTGEGKTITSALTLYLHSLSGETAVQFLTQESFARSDASSVKGIMDLLNVKVDVVTKDTNRAKVKELFMRKQDRDKLREDDPTVSSQPQIVYIPFSDFAFMRLEDVYYDADKKTLPEKMAYANFDEIDALIFEGSLMDFINAQPSDPLTEEQVQTYRLIWDFVLKIRGDGASLEQVKDTDKDFHVISDLVQSFQQQDESFLFKERQTSDGNFIELTDGARDLIRQLHTKAQEQNYKIPDIREFEDMVKITLEQHFFHKQRVNWTFEAKKDENGQVITDANNDVVQDIKLINAQGEHTNQRQSNHRHTIMEVWAKYYLGVNIDVLGDSETTGKVGGADVIKAFEKFTGFSGSIATEVARAEMKKLFGKDSIIEMAPFIQKVINRRETGVFNTKSERDAYLLDQVEQIFNKRDGAPILAGTRDYAEAEQLYTMMYDRLETMAEEEISALVDVLPVDKQASIREKINQFRDAKAIRAEGDATTMNTKRELALEIESELRLFMLDSYINELNNKQGRLDAIADTLAERIRINKDDQQAIDELAELNKLKDEFANIVESLQKHQANIQQLYTDLANAWKARDADTANTIISKLQNEFAGIEDQKIRVIDGVPSANQDEFLYLGFDQQTQTQIESLLNTVDRLSKVYTFHGNSFKTEAEEEEFLEIACARGSVTFVNPYGTRGKDFKLTLFKMSQFNTFMQDSVVKKALQDYYQANPQELDALIDLLELSDDQKTSLKNMVNEKFELGIFSILESLVKKLEDNRDALTRNKESQNIQTFFSRITDAINQSVSNPLKKTSLVDQLDNIEKNLRAQLIHGFQVFEVGISLSERITLQLFGRGGRAAAPRAEQTLIALEADETEIAVKAFNGVGTREGKQKLFEYINARELLEKSREEIKQTLIDMGITDEQALRDTMDTILTFQRRRKLERGILTDLSSQILAYLVDQNDADAKDKTRSFVEQLRTLSQEELLSQDFIDQAATVGLSKAHIDQIITVRFQETMTEAQATLEQAIMLARAKADVQQYMLSEQEQQLDVNKLNELVTIRARQLIDNFDAVIAANPDLADKLNRTNYTLSDQDMAAIDTLRNSLDSYTNTELDIANLFREAQEYLDIIDSEKRVTKSYFDDVEYRFSQQAGVLKSELEKDTYMTEDDVQFTLALNLKMLDSVFENYQQSNNFNQLQRDLAILGIEIDESAKDSIDSLKADLTAKIESGLITFLYDNAMDEAFRGANARLLKEWSSIKSQYQNELRQEIDKIKKNGLAKKEVRELVNMPFTIYKQTISDIEKSDLAGDELTQAKQNAFVQLQKDLGALNISITEADLEQLSNFQKDVVKQVDQGKITLDFVVFGGVLGPEFLIASKQLYDRTSEIRDQFQKNLDDQIKKVIDKFEAEIKKSFESFEDGILDSYAQSVMANRKQYVEQIEKSELLDVGTKEKNTARTVDDAVDQLYKQRKIDLMKSEPRQESRLVRAADRAVNFIMKNIFRRQKADDQLITRQKASNRVFEKLERVEETAEITPSAIFPVQAVNLSQDNRSIADKKELVKPQVKVTAQDGQLQYENIGDQEIQQTDQVIEGVKGAIKVNQREDGTKALEIEVDSMDQAAQAIIDRLEGYAAVNGGGLDLDAIIIKSNGETTATLELGKRAIFELQNRKYAPQLENLLKNGGLIKVGDNVIAFGKNKAGQLEGHDLGHIQDVSPEIFTVFQIKQLLDGIGGMQGLMMMSKDEQQAFFRDNPVVRSPLFSKLQMGQIYLENGVVLVGDNMYNKDNVAKGAILINAQLGDKVNVGRNSVIIDSEIGKYSPVSSDIGDNVQIRNAKIGRYSNIEDGARVSQVIVNGLTLGQDADVERINAATQSIAVGARSIVIDYESDQSLAVADDHYKQGVDQAMGYNSEQMGEMIIRDGGKVVETLKNVQNKLFKWSNQINKNYPENKFMQGISKALNFAGRLVSSITPEGRRWAAARKEQAARDEKMQEQYKDQRERLQQDLQTPYDFLFQLDPQESFASQVTPELEKIAQVADEDARRGALEGYVIRNFSQYSQAVQQHLMNLLSGVIDESFTSERDLVAILIDTLFTDVNDMMDRLDSMTSLEDIQMAEGLLDLLRRAYPDTKVTNTDARDIALKGAELAAQQDNTELQRSYLVKALNFNSVLLEINAQDADALRQEAEIFGKLNIDLEQMANAIEEQFKNVRNAIIAQLDVEPSLTAEQKSKLADYFLSLISLQTTAVPVGINPQIIQRQVGGFGAAKTDLYSYVADISVDQSGYLNFGQERSDLETDVSALELDIDAVRALININELDPSAQWSDLSDSWNTLLRDGKENYQDEFFDSIRPILQRFPVSIRNKVAGTILKSYSNAGSGIALRDDLLREAEAIQKDIDSGIWTGDMLRDKTHEALALMHIVAMLSPFDVDILSQVAKLHADMASYNNRQDINAIDQKELEAALIDAGIAVSRAQAVEMAQAIITQRDTTPIKFLDDISSDILNPQQKEMLRNANIAGSEEIARFHSATAQQINNRVLILAREQELDTTAALVMQQIDVLMQDQYVRPDQIDPLLEEFKKTVDRISNAKERTALQQKYDYYSLKTTYQKNQQNLSDQAEADARQEAQQAIQDALKNIGTKSPYYVDAQFIKAQMLEQIGDITQADKLYQSIMKNYPERAAEASAKQLALSTKQGDSIDFLTQARPESPADQQQAIVVLGKLRDSIQTGSLSQKPSYLNDMMNELLNWHTAAQQNGLSDQMMSEILQTISVLNQYVASLVSQNISNPDRAHDVTLWTAMQDTIISALTRLQSGMAGTELAAIVPIILNPELVNADGEYVGFVPVVAMLGDNLDLFTVDESGILNDQLQQYKMQQLADFIALFAPDAQVSMVGDKIMVAGLSDQQLSVFNDMFINGKTTALNQMIPVLMTQLQEWFSSVEDDQLAALIAENWNISDDQATAIAALKGQDTDVISEALENLITEKFLQKSLQNYMLDQLNDQVNLLNKEKEKKLADRAAKVAAQAPQNEIDAIDQEIASIDAQITQFQNLGKLVVDKNVFDTTNYQLITATSAAPAELPALANFLKNNDLDAYKQKINEMIDTIQAEIDAMEATLASLSNDQLRQLGRLKETVRELNSLKPITSYDAFNKAVAENTNLMRDIVKTLINNFAQAEQTEVERLQTAKGVTLANAARSASDLSAWMNLWESITDKAFRDTFADQFQEVASARNRFLYLQKLNQGASETELAPIRKNLEQDFIQALGQFGQYLAPQVISMIERTNGDIQQAVSFVQKSFGEDIAGQIVSFFAGPDAQQPTIGAVYSNYVQKVSDIMALTVERKAQELMLDEDGIFNSEQISTLRDMGISDPFSLNANEVAIMRNILDKMDEQKQILNSWLKQQDGITSQNRSDVRSIIFDMQGLNLGSLSPLETKVLQKMIPQYDLSVRMDASENIYLMPNLDKLDTKMIESKFAKAGVSDAAALLNQIINSEGLQRANIVFEMPSADSLFAGSPVSEVESTDDYIERFLGTMLDSVGFKAFASQEPKAAEFIIEYVDSLREHRPLELVDLDLAGFQFMVKAILQQRIVQFLIENPSERSNRVMMDTASMMFDRAIDVYNIVLQDKTNLENREFVDKNLQELSTIFSNLKAIRKAMFDEYAATGTVSDAMLASVQEVLVELETKLAEVVPAADMVLLADQRPDPTDIEAIMSEMSDQEVAIMQLCLSKLLGVTEKLTPDADDETHKRERLIIGRKFFKAVEYNKNRVDMFMDMLNTIVNKNYLQEGNQESAQYKSAIDTLEVRVRNFADALAARDQQSPVQQAKANIAVQPLRAQLLEDIMSGLDPELQNKLRAVFTQVRGHVGVDIVQGTIKADPIIEHFINQLDEVSAGNVKDLIFKDRMKSYFGLLVEQALNSYLPDETVFRETYLFLRNNGITSQEQSQNTLMEFFINVYTGAALSADMAELFAAMPQTVQQELLSFMENKIPALSEVRMRDTNTDKRVELVRVLKSRIGENVFELPVLDARIKQVVRNFLVNEMSDVVNAQQMDNQYVFAINFDAISENGKISVNESNFILKETIKAQEQRAKAEGKELRFAVVSDKFSSEHIIKELAALRLSELDVDVFAKDLGTGEKSFNDLIAIVQDNYNVDTDNIKMIIGAGNADILRMATSKGIQVMEVDPKVNLEKTASGEILAQTLVGSLNLFVKGTLHGFDSIPENTTILGFTSINDAHQKDMPKLLENYTISFEADSAFIRALRALYGADLSIDQLRAAFLRSLSVYILTNNPQLAKQPNINAFKEQLGVVLSQTLANEALYNQLFAGVFAQSMQSLVLQSPKQKISNAYLREFEKMKVAEEFA